MPPPPPNASLRVWQGKRDWKSGEVSQAQQSSEDWSLWKEDPVPLWVPPATSKSNAVKNKTLLHTMFFFSHIDVYHLRSVYHLFLISFWCSDQLPIPFNCSASSYNLLLAILPLQCCQRVVHTAILSVMPSPTVGHFPACALHRERTLPSCPKLKKIMKFRVVLKCNLMVFSRLGETN